MFSKLSTTRTGFTLLELLIVIFLLSLGYVSLFSSGLGQSTDTVDGRQITVMQSRDAIRYARRLAIANGTPVEVIVNSDNIQLFLEDGTATPSPEKSSQPYRIDSDFELSNSSMKLLDNDTVITFFFDVSGRPVSRSSSGDEMQPLTDPFKIFLAGYDNGNDDGDYTKDDVEAFLLISNLTGELIAL